LDKFLAGNTSEDNMSFSEIMKEAEKKQRLKHAWLYEKVAEQLEVRSFNFLIFKLFKCITLNKYA
jgi:protein DGCR14